MLRLLLLPALTGAAIALAPPVFAENSIKMHGDDTYIAGNGISAPLDAARDVFLAGNAITTSGQAIGDVHAAGFDLDLATQAAGDVYVAGASVTVRGDIGEDLTAAGYTVRTDAAATIAGNARLFGATLTIDSPITGALTAFGGEVILNAPIGGDVWIAAEQISFGPQATIAGTLTYASDRDLAVPERVIPAARVTQEDWDNGDMYREIRESWEEAEMPGLPTFMSLLAATLISLAFLIVLAAIMLTFLPTAVERMRRAVTDKPLNSFLLGIVGLSMLFGVVPVTALTIIGIPFVPIALFLIVIAWSLGYLLAAYAVALRMIEAFNGPVDPGIWVRLIAVALALVIVTILNFIPFVGWVVNYTLVLLGVGAMTGAVFHRMMGNPGPALDVDMKPLPQE